MHKRFLYWGTNHSVVHCQESQLYCQKTSSLQVKVTHVTLYFCSSLLTSGVNMTYHLAEHFLAYLWMYKHSSSACYSGPIARGGCTSCQQRMARRAHHNGIQSAAVEMRTQRAPTVSHHVHHWQLGSTLTPTTNAYLLPLQLAHLFFQSLTDSSGESYKLSWRADEQLTLSLWHPSAKCLESCAGKQPALFSSTSPTSLHSHPGMQTCKQIPDICKQISGMSLLHDSDAQNRISALTKLNTIENKSCSSDWLRTTHGPTKMSISLP